MRQFSAVLDIGVFLTVFMLGLGAGLGPLESTVTAFGLVVTFAVSVVINPQSVNALKDVRDRLGIKEPPRSTPKP